jgi:lysozyme
VKTTDPGINLIKTFEGFSANSYLCPARVWTIGYGHTGPEIKEGMRITEAEGQAVLKKDLAHFEKIVEDNVKVKLNQNQFDALVSFVFNVGGDAFKKSTLLKRLNSKEDPNNVAKEELPRWNKGDGRVLEGLKRRRNAEVDLFTAPAPELKTGTVDLTSKQLTFVKKLIKPSAELLADEKAKINANRRIPQCRILERKDKHTLVELGYGMGEWWLFDDHWSGLKTDTSVKVYATEGDLRYLRDFPYFYQRDNGPEGWRQCQTSAIAMCLKYIDVPEIKDDLDYLKIVSKHGDTIYQQTHVDSLEELGVYAKFTRSANADDIKQQIDKGLPVVAGVLHHGAVSRPLGGGHYIVITGYSKDYWLVQDPYGEIDLVNGGWTRQGPTAGKNQKYSFKNLNPRLFVSGGADGWCWLNFRIKEN